MKCYYHPERDAVVICKNCYRGLCPDCASEVSNGSACRGRCEDTARALDGVIMRNIVSVRSAPGNYLRMALLFGLLSLLWLGQGLKGSLLSLILGSAHLLLALFFYTTSRQMAKAGRVGLTSK